MFRRSVRLPFFHQFTKKFHDARLAQEAKDDAAEEVYNNSRRGRNEGGSPLDYYLKRHSALNPSAVTSKFGLKVTDMKEVPRSVLFVPCHKEKALSKIQQIGNDVDLVILDLEDSVPPESKQTARLLLHQFVKQGGLALTSSQGGGGGSERESSNTTKKKQKCRAIVRINSLRTDATNGILDLEAVMGLGPSIEGVAVPKVELGDEVALADYLQPGGTGTEVTHQVWAFFETPRSILDADKICSTNFYQYGVMGLNDLSTEMGYPLRGSGGGEEKGAAILPTSMGRVQHYYAMSSVVTACRANGVIPLDGVFNDPTDKIGFRAELAECRSFGFDGKTLIHPAQVADCNSAFTPTPTEVRWAERVVQCVENAGRGVAVLDGKMIEELHARQAAKVLARRPVVHEDTQSTSKKSV